MTYLLSEEGRTALNAVSAKPVLYAFDFDGTLAPISPHRNGVQLPLAVEERLRRLSARVPCAVVSGRALADLAPRLNGAVPYVIGNHGIESPIAEPESVLAAERICQAWKDAIGKRLADAFHALGVDLEDKRYSLTLHLRESAEPRRLREEVETVLRQLTPVPRIMAGKSSINVLPPGADGKGQAALALMGHLGLSGLFFVGDDDTDEDVFSLKAGLAMGVRVGWAAGSRAAYYLKHQGEIEDLLRVLAVRDAAGTGTAG